MGGRMILAAILGGLALFVWGALSHMVFQLGDHGMRTFGANEPQVAAALKAGASEHGLYFVPGLEPAKQKDDAARSAWEAKLREGPYAMVVVKPDGAEPMSPMQLVREFGTSVGLALIAVFLIVVAGGLSGAVARVVFCALLSLFGLLQHDVRFWNWYLFPGDFTGAQFADKLIGGVVLGLVIHLVLRKR